MASEFQVGQVVAMKQFEKKHRYLWVVEEVVAATEECPVDMLVVHWVDANGSVERLGVKHAARLFEAFDGIKDWNKFFGNRYQ